MKRDELTVEHEQEDYMLVSYGEDAYCEWCQERDGVTVVMDVIGQDWCSDILYCGRCAHEKSAIAK